MEKPVVFGALLFLAVSVAAYWLAATMLRSCDEEMRNVDFDVLKSKERE